ncbi:aminotransferase class I/II-fold pyridoxal phosphate-dependent enzyme [Paenibacillus sp. M-152]|nr:aminotransferase class I/II-fold pyridoxal phosphate-dependent enzyme [Paenibacillus sp. M-152]
MGTIAQDSKTKMIFLCSPHIPVGRVWTEEELKRLGEICIWNNVLIVSDEIHSDL